MTIIMSNPELKQAARKGMMERINFEKAWNKVTSFAPIELSCRWKKQFEAREQRLSFDEFMAKKKNMLHRFMDLVANEEKQLKAA